MRIRIKTMRRSTWEQQNRLSILFCRFRWSHLLRVWVMDRFDEKSEWSFAQLTYPRSTKWSRDCSESSLCVTCTNCKYLASSSLVLAFCRRRRDRQNIWSYREEIFLYLGSHQAFSPSERANDSRPPSDETRPILFSSPPPPPAPFAQSDRRRRRRVFFSFLSSFANGFRHFPQCSTGSCRALFILVSLTRKLIYLSYRWLL